MTDKNERRQQTIEPRGLRKNEAAAYCGLSLKKFEANVRSGRFPRPLPFGIPHVWDRKAIDLVLDRLSELDAQADKDGEALALRALHESIAAGGLVKRRQKEK